MSLREQQNLLARLYTDPVFRERFCAMPDEIGLEQGLEPGEIGDLVEIARAQAKSFSDSLVWKRFRAVEKLIPQTAASLGADFEPAFFRFAGTFNAQGVKKHYEDAIQFCEFLRSDRSVRESAMNTANRESTRLRFTTEGRAIAICRLRPGVLSAAIWLRIGRRVFHFTI